MFVQGLCKTRFLLLLRALLVLSVATLPGCFAREQKPVGASEKAANTPLKPPVPTEKSKENRDKSLSDLERFFSQADTIHREAWWVATGNKTPEGKTPFGKMQRSLLASENQKLSNKSLFRCDQYSVKRDVLSANGYPQKAEVFETCSAKQGAKKIAQWTAQRPGEIDVTFYPENLEEVLGLSASILNKPITCHLQSADGQKLSQLTCQNWSQERSREQMVRLDDYDYRKNEKNMIKLNGKVYENLTDKRKIEVNVPLEGKIEVVETELYAPEPTPTVAPSPLPSPKAVTKKASGDVAGPENETSGQVNSQQGESPQGLQEVPKAPGADGAPQKTPTQPTISKTPILPPVQIINDENGEEAAPVNPADEGWPTETPQADPNQAPLPPPIPAPLSTDR